MLTARDIDRTKRDKQNRKERCTELAPGISREQAQKQAKRLQPYEKEEGNMIKLIGHIVLSAIAALLCGSAVKIAAGIVYGYMVRPLPLEEKTEKLSQWAALMMSSKARILTIAVELYLWANIFVGIHRGM